MSPKLHDNNNNPQKHCTICSWNIKGNLKINKIVISNSDGTSSMVYICQGCRTNYYDIWKIILKDLFLQMHQKAKTKRESVNFNLPLEYFIRTFPSDAAHHYLESIIGSDLITEKCNNKIPFRHSKSILQCKTRCDDMDNQRDDSNTCKKCSLCRFKIYFFTFKKIPKVRLNFTSKNFTNSTTFQELKQELQSFTFSKSYDNLSIDSTVFENLYAFEANFFEFVQERILDGYVYDDLQHVSLPSRTNDQFMEDSACISSEVSSPLETPETSPTNGLRSDMNSLVLKDHSQPRVERCILINPLDGFLEKSLDLFKYYSNQMNYALGTIYWSKNLQNFGRLSDKISLKL